MPGLKIGIMLPGPSADSPAPDIPAAARHAERLGLESVWAADLVTGAGGSAYEALLTLTAAAAATERIGVGTAVLVLPQRPVAWTAAQVQTLQHLSGDRLLLGVGVGGFPGAPFAQAEPGPRRPDPREQDPGELGTEPLTRGARTDAALEALPGLVKGRPTALPDRAGVDPVTLAPGATMPPVLVGGNSPAAIRRAAAYGDAWFPSLIPFSGLAPGIATLARLAAEQGRPVPEVTVGGHVVIGDSPAAAELRRSLTEDHGMTPEEADSVALTGATPAALAEVLARYAEAGATRLVLNADGTDWHADATFLAEAASLLR